MSRKPDIVTLKNAPSFWPSPPAARSGLHLGLLLQIRKREEGVLQKKEAPLTGKIRGLTM